MNQSKIFKDIDTLFALHRRFGCAIADSAQRETTHIIYEEEIHITISSL